VLGKSVQNMLGENVPAGYGSIALVQTSFPTCVGWSFGRAGCGFADHRGRTDRMWPTQDAGAGAAVASIGRSRLLSAMVAAKTVLYIH
jgi:hypothetical protein